MLPSEPAAAIDLARTGLYARNLAATARISEQPQLAELVLAASATIGPRYAARLFELATAEHLSAPGRGARRADLRGRPAHEGLGSGRGRFLLPRPATVGRAVVPGALADSRSARRGAADARGARCRIRGAAGRAARGRRSIGTRIRRTRRPTKNSSGTRCAEPVSSTRLDGPSVPFVSGLEGGLDVRTTIRFWHEDQVYVRRHHATIGIHPERRDRLDESRGGLQRFCAAAGDEEQGGTIQIRPSSAACPVWLGTRRSANRESRR